MTSANAPASGTASAQQLASRLAARLCHDFSGALGGVMTGLDLLADPAAQVPADEALALIRESATGLAAQLGFARAAYGSAREPLSEAALKGVALGVFVGVRPTLDWAVGAAPLPAEVARVLLNLLQLAASAVATGGVVRGAAGPGPGGHRVNVQALGPRAKLHPEVAAGLAGLPLDEGLAGRWAQAAFVHASVAAAGGRCGVRVEADGLVFEAMLPA